MYRVGNLSKIIFHIVFTVLCLILRYITKSKTVIYLYIAGAIWLQLYLNGLEIIPCKDKLIKQGGSIFKRKTVFMLKNINTITIYKFNNTLPAILKLSYTNKDIYIFGFTGSQVQGLEKIIEKV